MRVAYFNRYNPVALQITPQSDKENDVQLTAWFNGQVWALNRPPEKRKLWLV